MTTIPSNGDASHKPGFPFPGTRARKFLFTALSAILFAQTALAADVAGTARLIRERRGHSATALGNGKVLVAGGQNLSGAIADVEIFDAATGTFSVAARLLTPRAEHTATRLADGRVILIGGRGTDALASTEFFDPTRNVFSSGPSLNTPRFGHTATLLPDGRVVVIGGNAAGTAEVFDPVANTFTALPCHLSEPRSFHAAVRLLDGTILVAGGISRDGATLKSAEILHPDTLECERVGTMFAARSHFTMRMLPDGKVQAIGGDTNSTMELFNTAGHFSSLGHLAGNADTLSAALRNPGRAAIIGSPAARRVITKFSALAADAPSGVEMLDRRDYTLTEIPEIGQAIAIGGATATGAIHQTAVLFESSAATVTTDKTDYSPSQTVTITGTGWQPGETVTLNLHRDTNDPPDTVLTAVADVDGNITNSEYVCQETDLGITFLLTATGQSSGYTAQTTFTDAKSLGIAFLGTGSGNVTATSSVGGDPTLNCTSTGGTPSGTCSNGGFTNNANITVTATLAGVSTFGGWSITGGATTLSAGCTTAGLTCTFNMNNNAITVTATFNSGPATKLAFIQQPTNTVAGATITPAVTVQVQDASGSRVATSTASTTLAIGTNPSGGTLGGTVTVAAVAGVATFNNLSINKAGNGYTLTASSGVLTGATSNAFNITATTTTAVVSSLNPSTYGTSVTFTATVTPVPAGAGTPTGTVTFKDGAATLGTGTLNGSGQATFTTSALSAVTASHSITAVYAGDGIFPTSTSPALTQTVNKKTLTPSITANSKVYDGNTTATLSSQTLTGVEAGDVGNVTLTVGASTFATKAVGTGKTVTATGLALAGTAAGNYQLSSTTATTTADITARSLTVSATATNKVYDGTTTASVTFTDNRVAGDVFTVSSTSATFADKSVGTGKTVTVSGISLSGADSGNYTFNTTATTTANITAKALTGSITAASKVYDGTTAATILTRTLTGVVGTDDVSYVGGTATFVNKNVGAVKTVTATGLSLSGVDAGNYTVNGTATTTANITARPLTVTATGVTKVYDGTTTATVTLADNRVAGDVFTVNFTSATFADKNVGTGKTVTVSGISLAGTDAANYTANTSAMTNADITAKPVTGNITANSKVYDGTTAATLASQTLTGVVAADASNVSLTVGAANFDTKNVGTGKAVTATGLSLSGSAAGNYALTSTTATTTASITGRPLTVTGVTANNKIYDGNTSASLNLGSAALVGVIGGDSVTLNTAGATGTFNNRDVGNGKTVTPSGFALAGTDAGNYTLTQPPSTTANITAKALTVTGITANNKVYDGNTTATLNTGGAVLVGVVAGDNVSLQTVGAVGTFADENVGTGKTVTVSGLTLGGNDKTNYTLAQPTTTANIALRSLTVSGITASNKVYDGTTAATLNTAGATLVGVVSGDTVTLDTTGAVGTFANKNVGTGKTVTIAGITIGGADAGNYTLTQPTATANITAKALTVTGITASNKIYDGTTTATPDTSAAALNGVVGSDVVTLNTAGATGAFVNKNAGTAKTVNVAGLTIGGADAGNYTVTQPSTTADITPKTLTVSGVTANNKIYDGTTAATVNAGSATLVGVVSGDVVSLNSAGATGVFADKNAGTGKPVTVSGLTLGGADSGNYSLSQPTATADITPKALTGSITANSKVYDATTAATIATRTLSGVIAPDVVSYVGGTATFDTKNVGTGKTVTATGLSLSGVDAGNYTVNTTATTTADITPRALTVTATGVNKQYDGTTAATVNLSDNRIGGDVFTVNYTSASFADKNVGTGKAVSVSGISISGADAANYSLSSTSASTTADITARSLTVTATGVNKQYDGTTAATVTLSDDRIGGDVFAVNYTSATFADKNAGNAKVVTVSGISISGADAGNYALSYTTAATAADITGRPLTISATGVNKVYDGTTTATVNLSDNRVAGDVFTDSYASASFADKNVGTAKTVSVSGISISGLDAANYTFNTTATTSADITPRTLTVSATGINKVYDGNNSATVTLSDDKVSGDVIVDAYTTATFSDENVGTGKTVTVTGISISGTDASNYALSSTTALTTADITKRQLTVTATGINKVYDGTSSASVTLSDNRVGGDTLTGTYTTASFADKNVGLGKTVSVSGISISGADADNYDLVNTTASTTADITPRALTVSAAGINKIYDGSTFAQVTLSDNKVSGDDVSEAYASASFSDKNVANGKTVSVSGITISGADSANYTFNTTAATTADITPRALIVSATGNNKVYDGTTTATVTLSDNRVSGDVLTVAYTTATFADKNVGAGKLVSVSGITLTGADSGNYTFNTTAATTADITGRPLTISATGVNKVYDGTTTATVNLSDNRVAGDVFTDSYTAASFSDKNVGTAKTVSVSGISISGADAANYTFNTTASTTADITPRSLTVSATGINRVYDGSTTAAVNLSDNRVTGDVFTDSYTAATFSDKNVGNGKTVSVSGISISGLDAANYTFNTTASTTADITPRTLTVSATGINRVYDGTTDATVTLSDDRVGGDVFTTSYASASFSDKNVGNGKTVSVSGISISGTDAANYTFNATASTTADITGRPLTIIATGVNKVYDGNTTATVTLSDNRVAGDVLTDTYASATVANKSVGTAKPVSVSGISISGTDAGNYTFNTTASTTADITPRTLTVSAAGINKVYDGTNSATVTLSDDKVSGDDITDAYTTATFSDENVGTGKTVSVSGISISGTDVGNYTLANTTASTTADITKRQLNVTATGINKVYDGNTTATVTLSDDRVLGDTVTVTYTGATFDTKNVGNGKTVSVSGISISGADAGNYNLVNTTTTTTADITPRALTVSATGINKIYDGSTLATVTLSNDRVSGDDVSQTYASASFSDKNVGNGKTVSVSGITISGADAGNYTFNSSASTTADITPRALVVSATGVNKVYDGNTTATVNLSDDRVSGDVLTINYATATFADKNVGTGKLVSVSGITVTGTDSGNYTFNTTTSTTANITGRPLTISAAGINKVYDGNASATVTLSDNRVSGDAFTTSYTSAAFSDKNVGPGKMASVSGISISGTDAGNYTFNTTASTTADITPRPLTISAAGINKTYDGTATATVNLSDNRVSGDIFTDSYTSASFSDKNVGTGKTVSVSGISIAGADAGNYTFNTTASTTANITPRVLTVSATGVNKVYDGNTTATVSLSDDRVSGDAFTTSYTTATFDTKNVGTAKTVSVSGISISGTDAGNYTFNTTTTATANITGRPLTISATGINKVYDGNTSATVNLSDDRVSGDAFTTSYTSAAFSDKNVGPGKTVSVSGITISGADAGNYTFNSTATTAADITPRSLTVSATGINKVYDGTTTATVTLSDNRVSGDAVTDSYTAANFSDKNVGNGKTVTVTGISISGADAGNYAPVNTTASTTADITPASTTTSVSSSSIHSATGQSVTFTATVVSATPTPTGTVTFMDGSAILGTGILNGSGQATYSTSTLSAGPHTITAVYAGDSNYSGSTSPAITQVVNTPPSVTTVSATPNPDTEGTTVNATVAFTDVDGADSHTVTITWGDGSPNTVSPVLAAGVLSFATTHVYADNPSGIPTGGTFTITAKVDDNFNGSDQKTTTIVVNNVDPVVTAPANQIANEGASVSFSLGSFTDPGADSPWAVDVNWGDSSAHTTFNVTSTGSLGSQNHTYADNGTYTVTVKVTDKDGGYGSKTFTVTVANVLPSGVTAIVTPVGPINENDSITLSGTFADPGTLDTHTVLIVWGDGSPNTTLNLAAGVLIYSTGHQYKDDNPTATASDLNTITVTVTDKDGGSGGTTASLTVKNVAPVITGTSGPTGPLPLGATASVTATFTDAGSLDTHTCTFHWDDGSPDTTITAAGTGNGSCSATHTYSVAGVNTVTVTVKDDDTGVSNVATYSQFIVIYDPNGGFVTGGGWILQPATGAFPAVPGKANFGFVSKYKKGSNVPDGETEFQFQSGDINFHSSVYDAGSLVISGGKKATYRGDGTVNGVAGYRFVLIATDGDAPGGDGIDKFRIKITRTAGGGLVYDNRVGSSEDPDLSDSTALGGGSIVIHK